MAFQDAWVLRAMALDESVQFHSPGFTNLFGHAEDRLGSGLIASSDGHLPSSVEGLGMSQDQLRRKVEFLETYGALDLRDVLRARPLAQVGCSLRLARKETGDVLVTQETVFMFESTSGELYSVSLYDDVTGMCSVRRLLGISGTGAYFVLLRALHDQLRSREVVQRAQQLQATLQKCLTDNLEGASAGSLAWISPSCSRRIAGKPAAVCQSGKETLP